MNGDVPRNPQNEIEAELTALLLGELAPEREAQVRAKMSEDAQLAGHYERLSKTIGLVREALTERGHSCPLSTGQSEPAAGARPRLSAAKREELLQHFKTVRVPEFERTERFSWLVPVGIAAGLLVLAGLAFLPALSRAKSKSMRVAQLQEQRAERLRAQLSRTDEEKPAEASLGERYFGINSAPATGAAVPFSGLNAPTQPPPPVQRRAPGIKPEIAPAQGAPAQQTLMRRYGSAPQTSTGATTFTPVQPGAGRGMYDEKDGKKSAGHFAMLDNTEAKVSPPRPSAPQQNRLSTSGGVGGGAYGGAASADRQGSLAGGVVMAGDYGGFVGVDRERLLSRGAALDEKVKQSKEKVPSLGDTPALGLLPTPDPSAAVKDGKLLYEMGKLDEAEAKLQKAFKEDPANRAADYYLKLIRETREAQNKHEITPRQNLVQVEQAWATPPKSEVVPQPNFYAQNGKTTAGFPISEGGRTDVGQQLTEPERQPSKENYSLFADSSGNANGEVRLNLDNQVVPQSAPGIIPSLPSSDSSSDQVPLNLKLPAPAFKGTPKNIQLESNGEKGVVTATSLATAAIESKGVLGRVESESAAGQETALRDMNGATAEDSGRKADQAEMDSLQKVNPAHPPTDKSALAFEQNLEPLSEVSIQLWPTLGAVQYVLPITNATTSPVQLAQKGQADGRISGDKAQPIDVVAPEGRPAPAIVPEQPEINTVDNVYSTFSLNVSDVSFKLAAAALEKGSMPDQASIRSEEFLNAFDYRDPEPVPPARVGFNWERVRDPFAHNRDLLRFSVRTAAQGRQPGRPLNIVLLLDNSGSMERADRVSIIREALRALAASLQPQDRLSIVTFSRTARLAVDGVPGSQAVQSTEEVSQLTPEGGTNLEEALRLGYETALRHYLANGVNRVLLLTDGAANLGNVNPKSLTQTVQRHRRQGVALDCFGIGWEGYNDDLLEILSRHGDGRYGFINTPAEAASDFAAQLAGALRVAAADVKVQVEFNPGRVVSYRQIGYTRHQLRKDQFRDNTVDAAEIGAAESGNALYVIQVNAQGSGPVAAVRARYKVPETGEVREEQWMVPYSGTALEVQQSSPAMRLATAAATFAEWLEGSPHATEIKPDALLDLVRGLPAIYGPDTRPAKLEWMVRQAKSITGQ